MNYEELYNDVVGSVPGNMLANQFRQLCRQSGIIPAMHMVVTETARRMNEEAKAQVLPGEPFIPRGIGPLNASVMSEDMTFKAFTSLLINVLEIESFELTTEIKNPYGTFQSVSRPIIR